MWLDNVMYRGKRWKVYLGRLKIIENATPLQGLSKQPMRLSLSFRFRTFVPEWDFRFAFALSLSFRFRTFVSACDFRFAFVFPTVSFRFRFERK
jgi:hypothetical protein